MEPLTRRLPGVRPTRIDDSRRFFITDQPARFAEAADQLLAGAA